MGLVSRETLTGSSSCLNGDCKTIPGIVAKRRGDPDICIGGWGVFELARPTGKSFRFVRACERARRGEAVWASERRFDSVARAVVRAK